MTIPQFVRESALVDGGGETSVRYVAGVIDRLLTLSVGLSRGHAPQQRDCLVAQQTEGPLNDTVILGRVGDYAFVANAELIVEGLEGSGQLRSAIRSDSTNLEAEGCNVRF